MRKERSKKQLLGITLRGMAIGAADVVPGVSGGTIAFISGIYEELIHSISSINLKALKILRKEGIKPFWKHINGTFFVALLLGIAISVLTLANLVTYFLNEHPVMVWSFFFGLVLASVYIIIRTIDKWSVFSVISLMVGTAGAAYIATLHVTASGGDLWYIFVSGAIAICAMILPGISGAFILVLMGSYGIVMQGLKELDLLLISVFASGCLVGILSFSHLLKYLFANFKNLLLAFLTGTLIGSLLKVWPWKNNFGDAPVVVHSDGREEWMQVNVWPKDYLNIVDGANSSANIFYAVLLMIAGFMVIYTLEKVGTYIKNKNNA